MLNQGVAAKDPEKKSINLSGEISATSDSGKDAKPAKEAPAKPGRPLTNDEIAVMIKAKLAEIRKDKAMKLAENRAKSPEATDASPAEKGAEHPVHWTYEGETGPAQWGKLNPAWAKCDAGQRQSPIDIRDGIKVDLESIAFDYVPSRFSVLDNGHTVQVNVDPGNFITLTGRKYELVQFHFHRPSEEKVNGRGFEMVAHLVHKDTEGRLAVVAVLIDSGTPHNIIQTVWNNLPLEKNEPLMPLVTIDLNQLLPQRHDYYTYMGSLTTPPCSEGVLWLVMKEPIQASAQQLGIFARLYPMNARPVQETSGRLIKESN